MTKKDIINANNMAGLGLILILLITFLSFYLLGRGWVEVLPLKSSEKFGLSFGISTILLYLLGFVIFILKLPAMVMSICLGLLLLVSLLNLLNKKFVFKSDLFYLSIFFCSFLILISIQGLLPIYNGSLWYFDWWEHWERSLFFLNQLPLTTNIGPYLLTARPPLFNVISGVGLNFLGQDFWAYQIFTTLLNSLPILSVVLLINYWLKGKAIKFIFTVVSIILLFNPGFVIESTFPWSKNLSCYFLLTGFYLYLKFRSGKIQPYLYLSALFLGSAILTHYSTLPYVLMIILDFLLSIFFLRKCTIKQFFNWLCIVILFISTWFSWATVNFGFYQTFLGNTSYEWQKNLTITQRLTKDISNLKKSLLPVLSPQYLKLISQQKNPLVILYDASYALYANTISGQISLTLSAVLFVWFSKFILNKIRQRKNFSFNLRTWMENTNFLFILVFGGGGLVSMLTIPNLETTGFAQLTLIPVSLVLISLAMVKIIKIFVLENNIQLYSSRKALTSAASRNSIKSVLDSPKLTRTIHQLKQYRLITLIIIGLSIEVILGIFLRIWVSSRDLNPDYLIMHSHSQEIQNWLPVHWDNYQLKQDKQLIFLADKYSTISAIFLGLISVGYIGGLIYLIRRLAMDDRQDN